MRNDHGPTVQVHTHWPHMLAKMLYDIHYKNLPDLTMAIADALAAQVKHCDVDVIQVDEANLPGSPEDGNGQPKR